jgi:hypothetical protein
MGLSVFAWHRHYDSDVFTCDVTSGSCRWFIGEFVRREAIQFTKVP